jgi:capsular exopolysaccharide synthesis family protein
MSKVFKALEQATRDRTLPGAPERTGSAPARPSPAVPSAVLTSSRPGLYKGQHRPGAARVDSRLVSLVDPVSPAAEQYRNLRHIVEQANRAQKISIIAVSSPSMGEGKTTTAINLAGALAQASEAQVLLIDADLRHPQVSSRLALADSTPGLVGLIHDPALTLANVACPCPPFNLWALPAGPTNASPYELLKSARLGQLLEEARARYDYVVLDAPPLVSIPDCRVLGRHVDRFLVVVAAHKTPARLLDEALRILPPAKNLGLVLNRGESVHTTYGYGSVYPAGGRLIDRFTLRGTQRRATTSQGYEPGAS